MRRTGGRGQSPSNLLPRARLTIPTWPLVWRGLDRGRATLVSSLFVCMPAVRPTFNCQRRAFGLAFEKNTLLLLPLRCLNGQDIPTACAARRICYPRRRRGFAAPLERTNRREGWARRDVALSVHSPHTVGECVAFLPWLNCSTTRATTSITHLSWALHGLAFSSLCHRASGILFRICSPTSTPMTPHGFMPACALCFPSTFSVARGYPLPTLLSPVFKWWAWALWQAGRDRTGWEGSGKTLEQ